MTIQSTTDEHIRKFGHTVITVAGGENEPPFAYTIGMTETDKHPEILVFGLPQSVAQYILNAVAERVRKGHRLADGDVLNQIANVPCAIKSISRGAASFYTFQALYRYEKAAVQPEFVQLVLPDRNGRFPWDDGYSKDMAKVQPELWNTTED